MTTIRDAHNGTGAIVATQYWTHYRNDHLFILHDIEQIHSGQNNPVEEHCDISIERHLEWREFDEE